MQRILIIIFILFGLKGWAAGLSAQDAKASDPTASAKEILSESLREKALASVPMDGKSQILQVKSSPEPEEPKNIQVESVKPVQIESVKPVEAAKNTALKESDIPVLSSNSAKKTQTSSPWWRIFMSFFVVALCAFGSVTFFKWYSKKNSKTLDNSKIRVLSRHYLGSKKMLAIIRVAGESILIGVTDENISMIKSLSLMDEEVPEEVPNNFKASLQKADTKTNDMDIQSSEDEMDEYVLGSIRDKVTSKLKNLRRL